MTRFLHKLSISLVKGGNEEKMGTFSRVVLSESCNISVSCFQLPEKDSSDLNDAMLRVRNFKESNIGQNRCVAQFPCSFEKIWRHHLYTGIFQCHWRDFYGFVFKDDCKKRNILLEESWMRHIRQINAEKSEAGI